MVNFKTNTNLQSISKTTQSDFGHQPILQIIIPAYNEAKNLPSLLREIHELQKQDSKFLIQPVVVNDGSKDDTAHLLLESNTPHVNNVLNQGIGLTIQTGIQYALSHHAEYAVQVDGDGQHIPSEIKKLFETMEQTHADVVIGSRFISNSAQGLKSSSLTRWVGGRWLSTLIQFLTGKKIFDTTSGFRLYNRAALEFLSKNYPDDYPEVEALVILSKSGFIIQETSVEMRPRQHGESSISTLKSIYYMIKVSLACILTSLGTPHGRR
jgi:glycosyltransferase involved in cell wall biosynthesis